MNQVENPSECSGFEKGTAYLFLFFIIAFNGWCFFPELRGEGLHHSDLGFHLSILKALDTAVKNGNNPFDFWFDETPFGFALFRSYQNLPYFITYCAYRLLGESFTLDMCMRGSLLILAMLFPLALFWTGKLLGFSILESALIAVFGSLISEVDNFGFGLQNYTFGTAGIYTQLWAVVALGPALALTVRYLKTGRRLPAALFFTFLCFGSHVVSAFVIFFSVTLFTLMELKNTGQTILKRFVLYFTGVALSTAYQWVFVFQDGPYINQSVVEPPWKYSSHGITWVAEQFWTGSFFDQSRFPCLTLLLLFGFFPAFAKEEKAPENAETSFRPPLAWIAASFLLSLSLLSGWDIWGTFFIDTPVLRSLHMHRFIIAVHLFGILLAAYGYKTLREFLPARSSFSALAVGGLVLLIQPALDERYRRYTAAHEWRQTALATWEKDSGLQSVFRYLENQPRTYVHPGMRSNWEAQIKLAGMVQLHYLFLGQRFPTVGGMLYHAFSLAGDTMFSFSPWRKAAYDLFGVGYVVTPANTTLPEFVQKVETFDKYSVWSSGATRLDVVDVLFDLNGSRKEEPRFMQRWVQSPLVEKKIHGAIHTRIETPHHLVFSDPVPEQISVQSSPGKLLSEGSWSATGITGEVQVDRPSFIVFKTGYHPNWKAWIDGVPSKTIWITPGFIATPVQPGNHSVKFEYQGNILKVFLFVFSFLVFGLALKRENTART